MSNNISIIIPTYNSINYISRTIHSLLEQKKCNIEIIVVDSGSVDGTVEFCKKHVTKILYCPPGNMYTDINMGISEASNEIVAYINSDDYYFENILGDYIEYFKNSLLDFAYSKGDFVDSNGRFRSSSYCPEAKNMLKYFMCGIMPIIQPSALFKKTIFAKLNGFDDQNFKYSADFDFCIRVFQSNAKIGYYKAPTVSFRVTDNQITNSYQDIISKEMYFIKNKYSTFKIYSTLYFKILYKILNIPNILIRSFRSFQISGKLSFSKAVRPFDN